MASCVEVTGVREEVFDGAASRFVWLRSSDGGSEDECQR